MDGSDLILTSPVMPSNPMDETANLLMGTNALKNNAAGSADTKRTEKLAKDFESVLMTKLFDSMQETVNELNADEEDSARGQVQGMFWFCLAQDVSDKGGLGLWKDLQRVFMDLQNAADPPASIDEGL